MGVVEGSHVFVVSIRVGNLVSTPRPLSESGAMRDCVGETAVYPDCNARVSPFIISPRQLATGASRGKSWPFKTTQVLLEDDCGHGERVALDEMSDIEHEGAQTFV